MWTCSVCNNDNDPGYTNCQYCQYCRKSIRLDDPSPSWLGLGREMKVKEPKAKSEKLGLGIAQIPMIAHLREGTVFKEGEVKYGKDNWKQGVNNPEWQEERWEHALFHLLKFWAGDTTEDHLAKVRWYTGVIMRIKEMEGQSGEISK